jgi:NADP-dependent 3-hydroxy acid dehydrogenase YdfG
LSSDSANTVIGFVRDKAKTETKISAELPNRKNIHILQGDMADYASLKKAVEETAVITGGAVDYVIANAGLISIWSAFLSLGVL